MPHECFISSSTHSTPPTQYDTLYTAFMRIHNIASRVMGPGKKVVVTPDLQLYDMAMRLWIERADIRDKFLFRPSELHVALWALTALGKYVEGSGIDQVWIEAGLYSPKTVTQILNGKNLYRSLEAHIVTLLFLYDLYFKSFLAKEPVEKLFLNDVSIRLKEAYQNDVCSSVESRLNFKDAVMETIGVFNSRGILVKLEEFEDNANDIQKYILNYIKQFETILQSVRATRQRDLLLHLESTEALIEYFFTHDHQNYARLLPIYIVKMQETQKKGVTNGAAGFTSIAPDHGIEHENRKLKVTEGIVGITQNEKALDRYFLIAPEVAKLADEFEQQYGMNSDVCRKQHHEITGGRLARVTKNAAKLKQVIVVHGDPFLSGKFTINSEKQISH